MNARAISLIVLLLAGLTAACAGSRPEDVAPVGEVTPEAVALASAPSPAPAPEQPSAAVPAPSSSDEAVPLPTVTPAAPAVATTANKDSEPTTIDLGAHFPAPLFELTLLGGAGETLRLEDLKGSVVLVNFWASWCPPCRWEMPKYEAIWQEFKDQGVIFVGIAVSDYEEDAKAFAEKVGVTYALGLDTTGDITRDYRVLTLPTTILVDRNGVQVRKIVSAANEAALRIFLKGLLAEK